MSATCHACHQEMKTGGGCTQAFYDDLGDGKSYMRILASRACHDCRVDEAQLHHPGCDQERCPRCQGQAIACECGDDDEYLARVTG